MTAPTQSETPRYRLTSGSIVQCTDGLGNPSGDWVRYSDHLAALTAERAARLEAERERDVARRAMFAPLGDNHHNAWLCPYCNPQREAAERALAEARRDVQRYKWLRENGIDQVSDDDCEMYQHDRLDAAIDERIDAALAGRGER